MALTPADVHNIAFSRPRIGKRGYNEQEVDLFIDLVEQELIRRLEEEGELRSRNAELRDRDGGLRTREAQLCQREAALQQHERETHQRAEQLRRQEAQLAQRAAQLVKQGSPLPQQVAQLRYREAQVAQRESQIARNEAALAEHEARLQQREEQLRRQEAQLGEWETELHEYDSGHDRQEAKLAQQQAQLDQREAELREQQADLRRRVEQRPAATPHVAAQAVLGPASGPPPQLRAVSTPVTVNGGSCPQDKRSAAPVHGRHDIERMAIRAVTDTHGNTVTETVHERSRAGAIDHGGAAGACDRSEAELLRRENADLERSLRLLKSAAALLAAALEQA